MATYDITAWSLPYVYGVQTYAFKEKLAVGNYSDQNIRSNVSALAYGYLVNYTSFADAKFLAALLNAKFRVRFAEKDFTYNGKAFQKGNHRFEKANEDKLQQFADMANAYQVTVTEVNSGFMETGFDFGSEKVHLLKRPNIVVLTGRGVNPNAAGEVWYLLNSNLTTR